MFRVHYTSIMFVLRIINNTKVQKYVSVNTPEPLGGRHRNAALCLISFHKTVIIRTPVGRMNIERTAEADNKLFLTIRDVAEIS